MDFFQRVGNFFSGKGWVSDDERRRKEQQVQAPVQPRPQPLQQVQQPNINRLNGLSGVNTPGLGGGTNIFSQAQQKVNPNPLQQANQATQQLNQNNQPKPLIPEKTVNDAPKVLTPQGQQDWVNKENKQIQIQNVINNPTQVLKTQVQQQQPKPAPVAIQQPQQQNRPQIAPSFANPGRNPLFTQNQDSLTRALDIAKQESDKYKAEQAARNDKLDNIMRARGVSEPEIAKNRQVRIDAQNESTFQPVQPQPQQLPTIDQIMEMENPETGDFFTEFEAKAVLQNLQLQQRLDNMQQAQEEAAYKAQVEASRSDLSYKADMALRDFPEFDPESDQYDEHLDNAVNGYLQSVLVYDQNGDVIGSKTDVYQLYKSFHKDGEAPKQRAVINDAGDFRGGGTRIVKPFAKLTTEEKEEYLRRQGHDI